MSKELTEQWKDGELPDGNYYLQFDNCSPFIFNLYQLMNIKKCKDSDKVEVLAPVPSYEEYKKLKEQLEYALETLGQIAKLSKDEVDAVQCASAICTIKDLEVK